MSSEERWFEEANMLRARLEVLERARQKARNRLRWLAMVLAVALASTGGAALAATGDCPNGLPICFKPNTPALAADVNQNFAQLKEWIEQKVGPTNSSDVTTQGATTTSKLTVNGPLQVNAAITTSDVNAQNTVAGNLTVNGDVTTRGLQVGGDLVVGANNSTPSANGAGVIMGLGVVVPRPENGEPDLSVVYTRVANTWQEVNCPNGTFVCGFGTRYRNDSNFWDALFRVKCCSL